MRAPSCALWSTPLTGTPLSFTCRRTSRWSEALTGDSLFSGTPSPKWNAGGASLALTPSGDSVILQKCCSHGRSLYQMGTSTGVELCSQKCNTHSLLICHWTCYITLLLTWNGRFTFLLHLKNVWQILSIMVAIKMCPCSQAHTENTFGTLVVILLSDLLHLYC